MAERGDGVVVVTEPTSTTKVFHNNKSGPTVSDFGIATSVAKDGRVKSFKSVLNGITYNTARYKAGQIQTIAKSSTDLNKLAKEYKDAVGEHYNVISRHEFVAMAKDSR